MSHSSETRPLLLEQLESRSLLSADLFADFTRSDNDSGRRSDRSGEERSSDRRDHRNFKNATAVTRI